MPFGGPMGPGPGGPGGPGLIGTVGRAAVVGGTAAAVSGRVRRRQQNRWAAQDQQAAEAQAYEQQVAAQQAAAAQQAQQPPAQPAPAAGTTDLEALERLASLHESGALTDEEFAAEKRKILGP